MDLLILVLFSFLSGDRDSVIDLKIKYLELLFLEYSMAEYVAHAQAVKGQGTN